MRAFSAAELLDIWEAGQSQPLLERAMLLLRSAFPEFSTETANTLPLGQKDALLFRLREHLFGDQLESVVTCPACSESLEFSLTGHDLGAHDYPTPPETIRMTVDTYTLIIRLPTVADVRAAAGRGRRLFDRIVVQATRNNEPVTLDHLPDLVRSTVAERLQEVDPLVDVQLALACPACNFTWQAPLEITNFLWQEIDHWARRTLYTVHRLASAYAWREGDILAMSAWRRQHYLELLNV